jgi:hypothetical protein
MSASGRKSSSIASKQPASKSRILKFKKVSGIPADYATVGGLKWGEVSVKLNKDIYTYKDAILTNQFTEEWNWEDFALKHDPGYTDEVMDKIFDYVDELFAGEIKDLKVFVSTGVDQKIKINLNEDDYLKVSFLQSEKAIDAYHAYVKDDGFAILFLHSTC